MKHKVDGGKIPVMLCARHLASLPAPHLVHAEFSLSAVNDVIAAPSMEQSFWAWGIFQFLFLAIVKNGFRSTCMFSLMKTPPVSLPLSFGELHVLSSL